MSNDLVRPIAEMGGRRQEMGRIRFGVKGTSAKGKSIPKTIDTFRFTSPDQEAIEQIAALYGGTAQPWTEPMANPQDQFEVVTTTSVIRVFLPPDGLSCYYELWRGSGCQRRCDGVNVELATGSAEDPYTEAPCVCKAEKVMQCKPKTRLQVILPEVKFGGVWRLETSSWNAAEEMPAMERMAQQLQAYGVIEGVLSLQKRSDLDGAGRRRHYIVPRIEFTRSPEALTAGAASVAGLGSGEARFALKPGEAAFPDTRAEATTEPQGEGAEIDRESTSPVLPAETPTSGDIDEDIVDAVIVGDLPSPGPELVDRVDKLVDKAAAPKGGLTPIHRALHAIIGEVANQRIMDPDTLRHAAVHTMTRGKTISSLDLSEEQMSTLIDTLGEVVTGERDCELLEDGGIRMKRVGT